MRRISVFKCPECGAKYKSLQTWGNHIKISHPELIPNDWSYARYMYFLQTGRKEGSCIVCKKPTEWNEATQKYSRFCNNPQCKKSYREMFKGRMMDKYGKVHLLNDPEQQRKMLANKHISGTYNFTDGTKFPYTGSYELHFLKLLDKVLQFNPKDLMMPSPHTYYYDYTNENDREHEGRHMYIPDAYIPSLNLEIEIKQNTSTHPKILAIDKVKEAQKDAMMAENKAVNYVKIVDKCYTDFMIYLRDHGFDYPEITIVKESYDSKDDSPIYQQLPRINPEEREYMELNAVMIKEMAPQLRELREINWTLNSKGEIYLLHGEPVAFYHCSAVNDNDQNMWLQQIFVKEDNRHCGIAEEMLTRAIRKYNISNIKIPGDNEAMIGLLHKLGFKEYSITIRDNVLFYRSDYGLFA